MNLVLYGSANLLTGTAQVDSLGYFAMELKRPLYDDILGAFTVTNEKYRRQRANVALFRHFAPAPRAYDLREMMLESPEAVRRQATARRPELFHWVDTLPNVRMLPEARKDGVRPTPAAGLPGWAARATDSATLRSTITWKMSLRPISTRANWSLTCGIGSRR